MSWPLLLSVALGGALGAVLRYLVVQWVGAPASFPVATLLVNVLGSFAIGIFAVLVLEKAVLSEIWRPLVMVGLLGGFTTFSAFSLEAIYLMQDSRIVSALGYVVLSVILCILAAFSGILLARSF